MINLSFLKLKGNIIENYELTKKDWKNKNVLWKDMVKVVSNSSIQYSCYNWKNGYKTPNNWMNDKQDCIILDLDDGMSIPEAQKRFNRYEHIIATTKSHRVSKKGVICDRFRVIIKAINIPNDMKVLFRAMELYCPENDKQTLQSTASFLGNDDAIVIYNQGKKLDMFYWSELAKEELKEERVSKKIIDPDLFPNYRRNTLQSVKEQLTYEVVIDVLESVGYEINSKGFFSLRDERTQSVKVKHKSLNIVDYGDRERSGDIFHILVNEQGMSFKESIQYVSNFI